MLIGQMPWLPVLYIPGVPSTGGDQVLSEGCIQVTPSARATGIPPLTQTQTRG